MCLVSIASTFSFVKLNNKQNKQKCLHSRSFYPVRTEKGSEMINCFVDFILSTSSFIPQGLRKITVVFMAFKQWNVS